MVIRYTLYRLCCSALIAVCCLVFHGPASATVQAAQSSEQVSIKVLLVSAKRYLHLSSKRPLQISGWQRTQPIYKLKVQKYSKGGVLLQKQKVRRDSFWVRSAAPIRVGRYEYHGIIEVKPHAGGFYIINQVPLETYVAGVIGAEVNTSWHLESLKVQAVIARSFALYRRKGNAGKSWHLTARTTDQVYKGASVADQAARHSAQLTRGQVVLRNNAIVPTFYHSNAGGSTEDAANVWNKSMPHIRALRVPYGTSDPDYHWKLKVSAKRLARLLRQNGYKVRRIDAIKVAKRTPSGRVDTLRIEGQNTRIIKAARLRSILGNENLRSLKFDLSYSRGTFTFAGAGFGHGVGLCQWCAKEMAERGQSYKQILSQFYYQIEVAPLQPDML